LLAAAFFLLMSVAFLFAGLSALSKQEIDVLDHNDNPTGEKTDSTPVGCLCLVVGIFLLFGAVAAIPD
jgi:hypothetical protein